MIQVNIPSTEVNNINDLKELDYFHHGGDSYIFMYDLGDSCSAMVYNIETECDDIIEGAMFESRHHKTGDLQTPISNRGNIFEYCKQGIEQLEKQGIEPTAYKNLLIIANEIKEHLAED
ncbi:hypothetical protein [Tenacibaculum phage PTm5]|uniref:Uncharacterized protein n=1 Tax=Tenacibaculum phage PTm5 TaxID=2547426 RepID=A0A5S9BZG3_9CAUD|nr:hypothetical protein [Tenacibaculum phage PTm5]